ncbi:MAG: hypothetical protein IJJ33_04210 [Victivallales bacterium]|nr:hypothetical protein [Victivallales bacterium]
MQTKQLLVTICALASALCLAEDFNGGFEQCKPDKSGVPLPLDWVSNKIVSRQSQARLAGTEGEARTGRFSLLTETEEGGCLSFRSLRHVPVASGDSIEMEIHAKGEGRFALQYIAYGADDPKRLVFISTLGTGKTAEASADEWRLHSVKVTFAIPKKAEGKHQAFAILPVIYVYGGAGILFDDFKMSVGAQGNHP